MPTMEMAGWLKHFFPEVPVEPPGTPCWVARMMNRRAEHNPPFYWLVLAMEAMVDSGLEDLLRTRLRHAHGIEECDGTKDEATHHVLTEACAFAWTQRHVATPTVQPAEPSGDLAHDRVRLAVPAHDLYVLTARLRQAPSMEALLEDLAATTRIAGALLPPARGRVLYLDTWWERGYSERVGYHLEMTEPVQAALRRGCAEAHLGHVFTRPFQWGNPVETHY